MNKKKNIRVLFTGGGTLGSVTPLLALFNELKRDDRVVLSTVLWVGTLNGVEKRLIENEGMPFKGIYAGKFRRYFSIRNFFDPFLLALGIMQSLYHVMKFRPDVIVGAGGYVCVPVMYAGWFLGKKNIIFQLDIQPSLSNVIVARIAKKIGVACKEELRFFPKKKTDVVGIPVRESIRSFRQSDARELRRRIGIDDGLPMILVLGGGTGAVGINELICKALPFLVPQCHIFHITGIGKYASQQPAYPLYRQCEFLTDDLPIVMAAADVVVTRAGLGVLSELSYLGKPTIIIPLPNSHQERNAAYFENAHAAVYITEKHCTPEKLARALTRLLKDDENRKNIAENISKLFPKDSHILAADMIYTIVGAKKI